MDATTPPPITPPGDLDHRHLNEDALFGLLLGRLPSEQRASCVAHLSACPDCENVLRQRAGEIERLRVSPVYRALLHEDSIPQRSAEADESPRRADGRSGGTGESSSAEKIWRSLLAALRRPRYVVGMTTGLAAIVLAAILLRPANRIVLPTEADCLPGGSEFTDLRGEPSPSTDGSLQDAGAQDAERAAADLLRAVEVYARRDLGPAVQLLQSAKTTGRLESIRLIYLGNALVHQGDLAGAVSTLRTVLHENLPYAWREEGQWTLLVALDRTGQRASADSLLKVLAIEPGDIGDRARRLVGKHGSPEYR